MKTIPTVDPVTLSNPTVREAASRAEIAAADALAAARQARLAKARLKTARKTHKQAKKAARKLAKRNRKAQAFLKSLLAKSQARESLQPKQTSKRPALIDKVRTGMSKKAKPTASRPVQSPRSKRPTRRPRSQKTGAGKIQMPPGPSAPVLVAGSPMEMGSSRAGGEETSGT